MNDPVKCGTTIVLAHLVVNIIHGAAHHELRVQLDPAAMLFVIGVILVCPLLAMVLLWTSQRRLGLTLLALSMAASAVFGIYKHFGAKGPDHVGEQALGLWGTTFVLTAYLLILTEAIGTSVGLYFLFWTIKASKAAR